MATENIEIKNFEDKETKSGKAFVRFKTNQGWMSCFNNKAYDEIKKFKGESVKVEIKQSGDFKNIEKFVGKADQETKEEENNETQTADDAVKPEQSDKAEKAIKSVVKKDFLVSYAKDAFCAIVGRISQQKFDDMKDQEVINLATLSAQAIKEIEKQF